MTKSKYLLVLAAVVLALAGCVSTKVDSGPIKANTFSFVKTRPYPLAADRAAIHGMVQDAITANLAAKGVSKADAGGDLTVAYLIIAGNNSVTTSMNEFFGDSDDATALMDKIHKAQTSGGNRNYFEAGTLFIDFIDSRTGSLLKRTSVQRELLRNVTPDVRADRIRKVVDEALKDLRISK